MASPNPSVSVVLAAYNRPDRLRRLLADLETQTLDPSLYEVVVVDDGSREPMEAIARESPRRYSLTVHRQANAGAAAARQRGVELARGEVIVIIDDDMQVGPKFVESHLALHRAEANLVVLGRIDYPPRVGSMPLFERFYAKMFDRLSAQARAGRANLRGPALYTGNVSFPRQLFFDAGGFDPAFKIGEDAELGVRLEKAGGKLVFSEEARTIHDSDHTSLDKWMARSIQDGVFAVRTARKHADLLHANPWRFLTEVNPLSRPLLALSAAAPGTAAAIAKTAMRLLTAADGAGLSRLGVTGTTVVYGMQYFQGVREETGSLRDAVREYRAFRRALTSMQKADSPGVASALRALFEHVEADHAMLQHYDKKYGEADSKPIVSDAVQRIGFQMMVAYRLMRFFHGAGFGLAAKACSRLMRHLYASDIHWEAELAPGVVIVHGFGLAIAGGAKVGPGCILFQHVTLGRGTDPATRESGAPILERDVHVGVGATLVGPLTVGRGSKIMAGCTLRSSVPAGSLVEAHTPEVRPRATSAERNDPA